MFSIGWSELAVIVIVFLLIAGPGDMPRMLRSFGRFVGQMRSMADSFYKQVDNAIKDSELSAIKDDINSLANTPIDNQQSFSSQQASSARSEQGHESRHKSLTRSDANDVEVSGMLSSDDQISDIKAPAIKAPDSNIPGSNATKINTTGNSIGEDELNRTAAKLTETAAASSDKNNSGKKLAKQ